ncbi:MAG: hypothetical protein P4L34_11200 [Paludibacter sp.]|nr:hypothetical protein [Paludibacter sp.]
MKKSHTKTSIISIIGITLILLAVLARRMSVRHPDMDELLSFVAGFAIMVVCFLILKIFLKNKK